MGPAVRGPVEGPVDRVMVPELPLLAYPVVIESVPLSPADPAEDACIVKAPLLESVVEPEIKLMDPPSPVVPEPPPIDTAPPAVAPEPPLRLNTPPSADLEACADGLLDSPIETILSLPSRTRSPAVPPDGASATLSAFCRCCCRCGCRCCC